MATRKLRLIVLISASMAAVTVLSAGAIIRSSADSGWRELELWTSTQNAAWKARDFSRPVLWGQAREGLANEHYARAEADAHGNSDDHQRLVHLWNAAMGRRDPLPADEAKALRERWAPAVAAMREGARCGDARPRTDVELGYSTPTANLLDSRWLVNMTVLGARDDLAAGRDLEAVHGVLDAATYGADYLDSPSLIDQAVGMAMVTIAVQAFDDECLQALDGAALAELQRGLEVLDVRLPQFPSQEGELLLLANWLVRDERLLGESVPRAATWRYGFSRRAMALEAWEYLRDYVAAEHMAPCDWPARQRWLADRNAGVPAHNTLLTQLGAVHGTGSYRTLQVVRAQLNMLRVAVAMHRGLSAPALPDPYTGEPLEVRANGDGWTLRCPGSPHDRSLAERPVVPRPR